MGWKLDAHQQNVYQISAKSKGPRSLSNQIKKPCASQSCFRFDDFKLLSRTYAFCDFCLIILIPSRSPSSPRPDRVLCSSGSATWAGLCSSWPTGQLSDRHLNTSQDSRPSGTGTTGTTEPVTHQLICLIETLQRRWSYTSQSLS